LTHLTAVSAVPVVGVRCYSAIAPGKLILHQAGVQTSWNRTSFNASEVTTVWRFSIINIVIVNVCDHVPSVRANRCLSKSTIKKFIIATQNPPVQRFQKIISRGWRVNLSVVLTITFKH